MKSLEVQLAYEYRELMLREFQAEFPLLDVEGKAALAHIGTYNWDRDESQRRLRASAWRNLPVAQRTLRNSMRLTLRIDNLRAASDALLELEHPRQVPPRYAEELVQAACDNLLTGPAPQPPVMQVD